MAFYFYEFSRYTSILHVQSRFHRFLSSWFAEAGEIFAWGKGKGGGLGHGDGKDRLANTNRSQCIVVSVPVISLQLN